MKRPTQNKKEAETWTGRPAWSHYIFLWFFAVIFATRLILALWIGYWAAAMIFGAGIILFVALAVFLRKSTTYRLTREAVFREDGVFGKGEQKFPIREIESVRIQQSPIDRLFGTGTLVLQLKEGKFERLKGIKAPNDIGQKIMAFL